MGTSNISRLANRGIRGPRRSSYSCLMLIEDLPPGHWCDKERGLRAQLERVLAGEPTAEVARQHIIESWLQSQALGLPRVHFDPPYEGVLGSGSPLLQAATPPGGLAADLALTGITIVLTEEDGSVTLRRSSPLPPSQDHDAGVPLNREKETPHVVSRRTSLMAG